MKKHSIMFALLAVLSLGCAAQTKPVVQAPTSPCGACFAQAKQEAKEDTALAADVVSDAAIRSLEALQKAEKYMQETIEEWKTNHPEMVATAEKRLARIRDKIEGYKKQIKAKLAVE